MRYLFNGYLIFSLIFFSIEDNDWYKNIQYSLIDVILNITNNDKECNVSFIDHLSQIYMYSDIDIISDFHKEIECSNISDFDYYLFIYQLNNNSESISSKKVNILNFTDFNTKFSTGICIPKNCSDVIKQKIFKDNQLKNSNIKELLEPYLAIDKTTYLTKENNLQENKTYANIILIIFFTYFAIRIIISFIGEYYFYSEKDDKIKKPTNKDDSENEEEKNQLENMINENEGDEDNNNEKKNEKVNKSKESILFKEELGRESFSLEKNNEKGFLFYFNLWRNFGIYNSKKETKWFKDENLELVNFFKSFFLFFCVFEYQIYSLTINPTRDFFNVQFYKNWEMIFIKFTKYASICYISLDGFVLSFKFFSFYKHYVLEAKQNINKIFYKFLLKVIPKILLYYSNFYFLHFLLGYYVGLFDIYTWQKYFFDSTINKKKCFQPENHLKYFFNYHSFDFTNMNERLNECDKLYYIYHNEFFILIIFIFIFLLLYNLQSKILEYLILIIIFIPYLLIYLIYKRNNVFNIYYFDGENYSIKYIYFFSGIYFIGILSGITYFHYVNSISNDYDYSKIPFSFLRTFSKWLYNISLCCKSFLIVFCCLIILILSAFYFCFEKGINKDNNKITFETNEFTFFIFLYEKITIVITFNFLLLLIIMGETFLSKIGKISLITLISRNSFTIFASYDSFIKLFYILFDYQVCLNIPDNLFVSFGEFTFIIFLSCFFNVLFELPLKIILIDFNTYQNDYQKNNLDKLNNLIS